GWTLVAMVYREARRAGLSSLTVTIRRIQALRWMSDLQFRTDALNVARELVRTSSITQRRVRGPNGYKFAREARAERDARNTGIGASAGLTKREIRSTPSPVVDSDHRQTRRGCPLEPRPGPPRPGASAR